MKVGDYVRTKYGNIGKIIEQNDYNVVINSKNNMELFISKEDNIKSSPNIIDLIEVGDYVNGSKVIDIAPAPIKAIYTEQETGGALLPIVNNHIESVLTKECFESMEYKVEE
jgi:hypothetical protein